MLIVSQNISNHNITFSSDVIYRINLSWINNLQELEALLKKHDKQKIFLDLPVNRIKPPNNKYSLDDIIPILNSYENIRYFAISNVNNGNDLESYNDLIPKNVTIVPKIESPEGISNVSEIVQAIPGQEKILMLDHDDLFSALTKLNESPDKFKDYINELVEFCKENNTILLRTIGVIFSDEEKRITEYVN
jgi:citrate lyase beta subunit